jgi:hypothetical protein
LCQQRAKLQLERSLASGRRLPNPTSRAAFNPLNRHPRAARNLSRQGGAEFPLKLKANLAARAELIIQKVSTKAAIMGSCFINGLDDTINHRPDN